MSVRDPSTIEEWRVAMLAILDAPTPRPRLALLIDRRHSQPVSTISVDQMTAFFSAHDRTLSNSIMAIVVSDAASFGMARMKALRSPDATIQVFRSYDAAVAWLTLELTR
jgi:hypothetical protein